MIAHCTKKPEIIRKNKSNRKNSNAIEVFFTRNVTICVINDKEQIIIAVNVFVFSTWDKTSSGLPVTRILS